MRFSTNLKDCVLFLGGGYRTANSRLTKALLGLGPDSRRAQRGKSLPHRVYVSPCYNSLLHLNFCRIVCPGHKQAETVVTFATLGFGHAEQRTPWDSCRTVKACNVAELHVCSAAASPHILTPPRPLALTLPPSISLPSTLTIEFKMWLDCTGQPEPGHRERHLDATLKKARLARLPFRNCLAPCSVNTLLCGCYDQLPFELPRAPFACPPARHSTTLVRS